MSIRVTTAEELDVLMDAVSQAQEQFRQYTQEQVDKIFTKCAMAASRARLTLAAHAVEEGGMGILEDKTIKNHFSAEFVHNKYKHEKTCGVVEDDPSGGYCKIAEPIGVLAGIVPCTNPTSTTIFKCLLALKTRNCIVFSPHPRTGQCTVAAAKLILDAAVEAGAPNHCIGWIDVPTVDLCTQLMRHPKTVMIVATGAGGLVKAAYSSGKPAMGGGAGNTPVLIDELADVPTAVNSVLLSKTFDNGMICASEQAVIVMECNEDAVVAEFEKRGAYFLKDEQEKKMVGEYIIKDNGGLNPAAVGQPAYELAKSSGLPDFPPGCRLLLARLNSVGPEERLSHEKLCPCLGFYVVPDFDAGLARALELVRFGGMGHTSVLYTNMHNPRTKKERVTKFQNLMPTGRTLIGMPTSQGAIGDVFNFRQMPSLSLGCGSWGSNATAEGLQVKHLLNYKQVCERREHILWFRVPPMVYLNRGILTEALKDLATAGIRRVFIVTDNVLLGLGVVRQLTNALHDIQIDCDVFSDVLPDPDTVCIDRGIDRMKAYQPDCIIGFGGGSPMDAAKVMRLKYDNPNLNLEELFTRFMDIRKRVADAPSVGLKIKKLVCISTTSGTGAEMTPYASLTDSTTKMKNLVVDASMTPDIAIVDADLCMSMPPQVASQTGMLAMCHSLEAYTSMFATDYTHALALKSARVIFANLSSSVVNDDTKAREAIHSASSMAGMAIANAFTGIANAMATQLDAFFRIPLGLANAMVICQVIKFNAEDAPSKQGTFPQYAVPKAKEQYAQLSEILGFATAGSSLDDKVDDLVGAIQELKEELKVPMSIREYGINAEVFREKCKTMATLAFDHQCAGINPRYPLIKELQQLFMDAYNGDVMDTGMGRVLERKGSYLVQLRTP